MLENKFSHITPQSRQSSIAIAFLGQLSAAAAVRIRIGTKKDAGQFSIFVLF